MMPRVLIPVGYGLNCEEETAHLFKLSGSDIQKVHINDIRENPKQIADYHIIVFIGGFSDGDHIGAGKVHANRLRYGIKDELNKFILDGNLVLGICNGFQALVKAGFLPGFDQDYQTQKMTITYNDSGKFEDRWVHLGVNSHSNCIWTRNIEELYLPARHGEGKVRILDPNILDRVKRDNQIVAFYIDPADKKPTMEYPLNPNGSDEAISGLCDSTGRIFGLMPHPEAFWSPYNHPYWPRLKLAGILPDEGAGLQVARNGVEYARDNLV